jgi:membrane protein DedA with SNARE-associated domain
MTLPAFIEQYGYLAVFLGCFFEGETVLVLAGFAAHLGYLWLPWVVAVAAVAGFCGDELAYLAGRVYGPRLAARWPRLDAAQRRVAEKLAGHAFWVVFLLRFAVGFRIATPIAVGASGMPALRFALPNAAGALVWAVSFGAAGYAFGTAFTAALEHAKRYEEIAFAVLAAAVLATTGFARLRRRDSRRAARH